MEEVSRAGRLVNPRHLIRLVAIETTGLEAENSIILEAAIADVDTSQRPIAVEATRYLFDPKRHEFTPEIVRYHTESGLLRDVLRARREGELDKRSAFVEHCTMPAKSVLVWQAKFARPHLAKIGIEKFDDAALVVLLGILRGTSREVQLPKLGRALPKVAHLVKQLKLAIE